MLNTITLGDCLAGMRSIDAGSVDLIIADPPYGIFRGSYTSHAFDTTDAPLDLKAFYTECRRLLKPNGVLIMFCASHFMIDLIRDVNFPIDLFKFDLIWSKNTVSSVFNVNRQPLRSHETMLLFYDKQPIFNKQRVGGFSSKEIKNPRGSRRTYLGGKTSIKAQVSSDTKQNYREGYRWLRSVIDVKRDSNNQYSKTTKIHPTKKPLDLIELLVRMYTNEGSVVLDPFSGSGVTAVACKRFKRDFYAFELNETYHKASMERLNNTQELLVL